MVQQSLQGTAPPRSQDELEGTLLLAVQVDDEDAPSAAPTAVFQYEDATVDLLEQQPDNNLPAVAPLIPKFDTLEQRDRAEAHKIALGKLRGLQQAELEKEQLRRADVQTYATNYHASRKVAEANRIATERNAKGVEIEKDTWFGHEKQKQSKLEKEQESKTSAYAFASSEKGGYEVSEYQMGDYEPSDGYQFSEYKSIYDK